MTEPFEPDTRRSVPVSELPIPLGSFLKLAGVVRSGGEAKAMCNDLRIRVNGEVEARRGRSLQAGDRVEIDRSVELVVGGPPGGAGRA